MRPSLPWRAAALAAVLLLGGCRGAMTPLHEAAVTGNTAVVKEWIAGKRNLDPRWDEPTRGLEGNYARQIDLTPLMLAARRGNLEITRLLVEGGADVHAQSNTQLRGEPKTPFDFAVESGNVAVAEYLWKKSDPARVGGRLATEITNACVASCREGSPADARSNMALFLIAVASDQAAGIGVGAAACYAPKPLELLEFVEKHAAKPPRNTLHCLTTSYAAYRPFEERRAVLTWMIDHGAEVNGQLSGWTPLMRAAVAGDLGVAKLLVERGADPNVRGSYLPPVAAAANSCIHPSPPGTTNAQLEAQLAMVQYLASISARSVYSGQEVLKQADLIGRCCAAQPQAPAQRRICEVFGL